MRRKTDRARLERKKAYLAQNPTPKSQKQKAKPKPVTERELADICVDCGEEHCAYYVFPKVWETARLSEDQPCCIGCLQERLGRDLTVKDFDFTSLCNFFLPDIESSALPHMVRQFSPHLDANFVRRIVTSVLDMRRKHPHGLTLRKCMEWASTILGWTVILAPPKAAAAGN